MSSPDLNPPVRRLPFDVDSVLTEYDPDGRLERFFEILMVENSKVNLVSRETSPADLRRLAAESLLPLELMETPARAYLDIGSGGGFPAIPIVLSGRSGSKTVLVERTLKKAAALDRIRSSLALTAQVLPRTFEEVKFDDLFDLVTLRWVKLDPALLRRIGQVLAPGGSLIHYSSPLPEYSGFEVTSCEFVCPESSATKQFTLYKKKLEK